MVQRWVQQGLPSGRQEHRCRQWAAAIGGILDVAGLGEYFLANADEAAGEMDESLRELAALAAYVVKHPEYRDLLSDDPSGPADCGRQAAGWVEVFQQARVQQERLAMANEHSRATIVGQLLGAKVGRPVKVETDDGYLAVALGKRPGRSRKTYYYIEVIQPEGTGAIPQPVQGVGESRLSSGSSGTSATRECSAPTGRGATPAACAVDSPGSAHPGACGASPPYLDWLEEGHA
jgi:hypothetical protein